MMKRVRSRGGIGTEEQLIRAVKREHVSKNTAHADSTHSTHQNTMDRRLLRSRYHSLKNLISEKRDDLSREDSDKFKSIISEVEDLHQLVQKPREQVADAEALLDIANSLVTSVKSQTSGGVTPSDFITCLLSDFGQQHGRRAITENDQNSILWKDIGLAVSPIFRKGLGCCTVFGPMNTELKQRKVAVYRKRTRPTGSAKPNELDDTGAEQRTDTDKNMSAMFEILRRKKRVKLESLLLDRKSFARTVENLFAMSFLVKDGRAEIVVDEKGSHLVSPRNAPAANSVMLGEVTYSHFVFRFDYKDWKLMLDLVPVGEELMPHRDQSDNSGGSQARLVPNDSQAPSSTTPIRKLSRNRGLVIQKQSVIDDSLDMDDATAAREAAIRTCKRELQY